MLSISAHNKSHTQYKNEYRAVCIMNMKWKKKLYPLFMGWGHRTFKEENSYTPCLHCLGQIMVWWKKRRHFSRWYRVQFITCAGCCATDRLLRKHMHGQFYKWGGKFYYLIIKLLVTVCLFVYPQRLSCDGSVHVSYIGTRFWSMYNILKN